MVAAVQRLACALVLLVVGAAAAQEPATVPFAGTVKEKGTRVPIPGVDVVLDGGDGVLTDADGKFAFPRVAVGKHKVSVRGAGWVPADTDEELKPGKRLEVTYYVMPAQRYKTVVRSERLVKQTLEQSLDVDEIKHIPGTQGDALKSVQTLPGVARAPFGLGQLIVWGSAPGDTRTYVDGVAVPALYHFGGLRSTVNSNLVDSLTFTPGGYNAEFGRGLGGVVEVDTRRPKDNGYHGYLALDLLDGSLLVEGPITKTLSFAVAARRSWIDVFLPLFTPNDLQLSPRYWDYQAELRWRPTSRDDIELLVFGSDDTVDLLQKTPNPDLANQFHTDMYFHRLLVRWMHRFENGTTLTFTPSAGYDSPVQVDGNFGAVKFHLSTHTIAYNLRAALRIPVEKWLRLDVGLDFEGNADPFDLSFEFPANLRVPLAGGGIAPDGTTLFIVGAAPWAQATFTLLDKRLTITPGIRAQLYHFAGYYTGDHPFQNEYWVFEPRLQARYQINKYVAVKAALGVYHQPPDAQSLSHSVGNSNLVPETAFHYVLGVDVDPTPTTHVEVVGFYKDMRGLIVNAPTVHLDNEGEGRVYGGELLVRQHLWRGLFGWLSYTISRAERRDHTGEDWHVFQFDQTHILSVLASYQLPRGFQVGARFRYVTGNPTTMNPWYWDANSGNYQMAPAVLYNARLDAFQQLDIRFDKTFTYRWWKFSIYLDVQNVYNHANPEAVQFASRPEDVQKPIAGLPILPVVGVQGEF